MNSFGIQDGWHWAAFGKHPATADYFRLGESSPFVEGLTKWVEEGYRLLGGRQGGTLPFCSWRFWARGFGRESLVLGLVRVSSDSLGRPYPLLIMGSGPLDGWEERWDLLPIIAEAAWCQLEYLATHTFNDLTKLERELATLRPPTAAWDEVAARRQGLNRLGSPLDPYASFLDLPELERLAAAHGAKGELRISLDRGPVHDKIVLVSLWHHLVRGAAKGVPNALFMGGGLERSFLAVYRRALAPGDFFQLWSAAEAGALENSIGTEYVMDIATLGKDPIRPDQPVGQDVRYDPLFDTLQAEVDKLTSPAIAGTIDWEKVVRLAADILATRSKDLLVASYLAVGLVQTRREDGLVLGLRVLRDLLERFWADLFPTRMRGRQRSLEWWLERTEHALRQLEGTLPADQQRIASDLLAAIAAFLNDNLEEPPSLSAVRELIERWADREGPAVEPEPPPLLQRAAAGADSLASPARQFVSEPLPAPVAESFSGSPLQVAEASLQRIGEAAGQLLQQEPTSPLPYRLLRVAAWGPVVTLPPATDGRTRIPAPERQVQGMLHELANHGDGEALLKAAEARLPQFIFWLDLNRLTAEGLCRLGDRFGAAHDIVCHETAALLQRLPGLDRLSFADGTPFASPETRQWLAGITACTTVRPPAASGEGGASRDEEIEREIAEAHGLVRGGRLLAAVERFCTRLGNGTSRQEQLHWRLALCRLLMEAKRTRLALPHLEQVIADIDSFALEEYDPPLALQALKLAWAGFDVQAEPRFKEKATDTLHRIARLDPVEMVRLEKGQIDGPVARSGS